MPDLAVIMSIYKNDKLKFVRESVESILNQTFFDFHYYVVFDGPVSNDIENYIDSINDKRLFRYRLEKNEGLAMAMNFLLDIVMKDPNYKFIARMDADDVSMPVRFEIQREYLLKNPDISIVGCWYEEIDEYGKHLSFRKLPVEHEAIVRWYYYRTPFAHPSVIYRHELIERVGFYPTDTILMEDNVLWGRALTFGLKFSNISETLFKFRLDKRFFNRRSGIKYGLNYLKTRIALFRMLKAPLYAWILSFGIGLLKIFPSFFLKFFYRSRNLFSS